MSLNVVMLITESVLAIIVVSTTCFLAIAQRPIPDILANMLIAIIAFYFGQKVQAFVSNNKGIKSNE